MLVTAQSVCTSNMRKAQGDGGGTAAAATYYLCSDGFE